MVRAVGISKNFFTKDNVGGDSLANLAYNFGVTNFSFGLLFVWLFQGYYLYRVLGSFVFFISKSLFNALYSLLMWGLWSAVYGC